MILLRRKVYCIINHTDRTSIYLLVYCNGDEAISRWLINIMFHLKVPSVAPGDVRAVAINSSSISVEWTKPNKSVLHGMLRRYEIDYRRVECNESDPVSVPSNTTWTQVIVSNASSSKVIGGLVFWSCYELRMRAVTVGNGPYSTVQQLRTKEDGKLLRVDVLPECETSDNGGKVNRHIYNQMQIGSLFGPQSAFHTQKSCGRIRYSQYAREFLPLFHYIHMLDCGMRRRIFCLRITYQNVECLL